MRLDRLFAAVSFVGLCCFGSAFGLEPVNPNLNATAREALDYLESVYQEKVLCGYKAVDGDYHSTWSSGQSDDAWIYVDLGGVHEIDRVNLMWGWKIHAADYSIDVTLDHPESPEGWTTIYRETERTYVPWEATDRIVVAPVGARYVRMHATKRAGRQTWAGYHLAALEVPVRGR